MWNLTSRVHQLQSFSTPKFNCYVKRDDELSCGISGTKLRKYSSIVPFLVKEEVEHLIIIAGPQSNNLLAALQIARELQLKVTAFLLKPKHGLIQGNFKLSLMFLEEKDIVWIERSSWFEVELLALDYLKTQERCSFILNEGANVPQAMDGAMSLAWDIQRNEKELGFHFDYIFVDAGTGFAAAALINGLAQINHPALIHVLLLADQEEVFSVKLNQWINAYPNNFRCFYPSTARAFGSINQTIKNEIKRLAKEEGVLSEPIYSAKLFYETRRYIKEYQLQGTGLIIHSGGLLTMTGFSL
ncbi:pyridoxal-phosphate dependent enzyme [Legionella sp. km772]|uniref:pyridoxal-phosphate dependent enzyme n=1 Tax=Legionella sp. km772 TaxID=2498111 RepID=UPI000F8C6BE6|nr:pyridoxal-phosphate dependent enzyme [Legionella sp. km772]RUR08272.1 pyridoxal-phosphate dependent enzyme [Legionella sp. km772]